VSQGEHTCQDRRANQQRPSRPLQQPAVATYQEVKNDYRGQDAGELRPGCQLVEGDQLSRNRAQTEQEQR
jgi:hypothetical protein